MQMANRTLTGDPFMTVSITVGCQRPPLRQPQRPLPRPAPQNSQP